MNILIEFEDNSLVFDSSKIYLVGRERSCDIQLKNLRYRALMQKYLKLTVPGF